VFRYLILILCLVLSAAAQTTTALLTGSTAPGATVRVTSKATSAARQTKASAEGRFSLPALPPGDYSVEVSAPGFLPLTRNLTLTVNSEVHLEAPLARSGDRESMEVRDTIALLKTESAATGGVVLNQQIVNLPLDGRNYFELAMLLPGSLPAAPGSANSVRGNFSVSINGAREDANGFLLDGVYNGDPKLNGVAITSPVDGIREFELAASNYDASFGRNAGAQFNVVLKSGANALHGTAYEFFRNSSLDARNFFAPAGEPDPRYQRNQFGGSVGGALVKDRAFFFADYEGRRSNEGIPRRTNVPSDLERTGDFSQSGVQYILDPFTRQPFPGNKIPANRIHPTGQNITNLYPRANATVPGQNFIAAPIQRDDSDTTDARLDHALSQRTTLQGRYSFSRRGLYEPYAGASYAQIPGYGNNVPLRNHNAMAGVTHVFSPSLIAEARLGFSRTSIQVNQQNQNVDLNTQVGLPRWTTNPRDNGLSLVSILGYSPIGDEYNNPQKGVSNTYQANGMITWTRGRSTYKFGGDIRKLEQNAFRDVQSRGFLQFVGITGAALSDLLQGLPYATGGAKLDNPQALRAESYNGFIQTTHRAAPGLTLSAGIRYEFTSPPVDPRDRATIYNPDTGGLSQVGTNGIPRAGYRTGRNNWAPRAGFAWTLPGSGQRTVLRGGYGIYFDQSPLAPSEGLYFSQPYFDFRLFVTSEYYPLTLNDPFPANYPFPIPGSSFTFQRDLGTPYMQHWNLQLQQSLGRSRVLELGYVGSKGTGLYAARDINQPAPSATPIVIRPNRAFDDINRLETRANSNYHALQSSFRQTLTRGVSVLAAYTLGKSIDDASGFFPSAGDANFPQDSRYTRLERARSNFDIRQRFTAAYTWLLPRGWSTHGILTLQDGRPFTVALPSELDISGTGRSSLGFGANDRPNVVGDPALSNPSTDRWFNTAAFAFPNPGSFGNAGRNILSGPGLASWNLSLMKDFRLAEQTSLQFRAETFNALNRANFDLPGNFIGAANYGRIASAQNARLIQLGLKLLF
jgi:hypothetical protein